jgi:hypothetical protein
MILPTTIGLIPIGQLESVWPMAVIVNLSLLSANFVTSVGLRDKYFYSNLIPMMPPVLKNIIAIIVLMRS